MNNGMFDRSNKASARRRLVRGAFAAPVALTLCNGNAFAAASNLRVLTNQLKDPQAPAVGPADTWIRVQVYKSGSDQVVALADVRLLGCVASTFFGTAAWAKVSDSTPFTPPGSSTPNIEQGKFAAVLFDKDGIIVGVANGTTVSGRTAASLNAWMSFSGAGCN